MARKTIASLELEIKDLEFKNKELETKLEIAEGESMKYKSWWTVQGETKANYRRLLFQTKDELFDGGFSLSKIELAKFEKHEDSRNSQTITINKSKTPGLIKILKGEF